MSLMVTCPHIESAICKNSENPESTFVSGIQPIFEIMAPSRPLHTKIQNTESTFVSRIQRPESRIHTYPVSRTTCGPSEAITCVEGQRYGWQAGGAVGCRHVKAALGKAKVGRDCAHDCLDEDAGGLQAQAQAQAQGQLGAVAEAG